MSQTSSKPESKPTDDSLQAPGAQTLRRGLAVLKLLARISPRGLRVSDIGRQLGLNKATAIRLTHALVEEKFLVLDDATRSYRLGPEAFAVGLAAEPSYALQRLSAPHLRLDLLLRTEWP
jgi:DNA-binding IclR family transcriptional regulator